jgi:DNA-binding NarL/FixJ family response regulator
MRNLVVLVVDSSALIIERWQNILSETENIKIVYGAVAYNDASILYKEVKPNVVLLDGDLPGTMSMDLLKEFKASREESTVIVLANNADNYVEEKCKLFGADYFFDKYNDFEKIPAFISANSIQNSNKAKILIQEKPQ